ncbi:MAG: hypothetical protein Q8P32_03555 [Candidatus Komeilibacteria bacterium]|nr:hypothetical protein [Candidatus Komeilibacteria bacterium]
MKDAELRGFFTSIKEDANRTDEQLNHLEKVIVQMDKKFDLVLDITGRHESSISYHGAMLVDHKKRIVNLEHRLS